MKQYQVAYLPGDGIGPEVAREARLALEALGQKYGFAFNWAELPFGAEYYLKTKEVLPASALGELASCQALLLGAIGDPRVKPGILEQDLLLALRFHFDQYLNLRPAQSFPKVPLPVRLPAGERLDCLVVRENTEDLYMGVGLRGQGQLSSELSAKRVIYSLNGKLSLNFEPEVEAAVQLAVATRPGVERIARAAFNLAEKRGNPKVTLVSKANAVPYLYGFWDEVVKELQAKEFAHLKLEIINIDALCYLLPRNPLGFGLILAPNLFGDIVSDLIAALAGGLGLAASANIGPSLAMFEPVHGSAPDIAGTGKANPLAAILSAVLLLDHLGEAEAAQDLKRAVWNYLGQHSQADWPLELGGQAATKQVGQFVVGLLK